ncbi:14-3-3 protein, putative [Hepatocystis sp. ex Piliocolobus tephrosceles]|nr:14-3-3 protein, putative [Hepatocystis sp. ex Piliocolobus tephrosceles]
MNREVKINSKSDFIHYLKILNHVGFFEDAIALVKSVKFDIYCLNYTEAQGSVFRSALNVKRKEKKTLEKYMKEVITCEARMKCAELHIAKLIKDIKYIELTIYNTIKNKCITKTNDEQTLMCYWHLIGDVMRYSAETMNVEKRYRVQEKSQLAYTNALKYANKLKIPSSRSEKLEVIIVLNKDMGKDINVSIEMLAQAFRDAIQNMHLLESDDECPKTIAVLGVLRDYINKWCEVSGRKNVNELFEIDGKGMMDKYENMMNNMCL